MDPTRPQPYVLIANGHPPPTQTFPGQIPSQNSGRQSNGQNVRTYALRSRVRPPTVHDALPFSPFTSIVPFTPDILPFPSPAPSIPSSLHPTPEDSKRGRKTIDKLNAEASNPQRTSQLLDQSLRELQRLLRGDELTQYKFPTPPSEPRDMSSAAATPATPPRAAKLSAFAKMVMDRSDITYRYPTPTSPDEKDQQKPKKRQSTGSVPKQEARRVSGVKPEVQISAQQNLARNQQNAAMNRQPPQQYVRPQDLMDPVMVQIPVKMPASSQRFDYREAPEIDAKITADQANLLRKRKREVVDVQASLSLSYDQREKADVALSALGDVLEVTFEAEEKYETDAGSVPEYFSLDVTGPNDAPFLTKIAVSRLDSAIQKVSAAHCLTQVPLEDVSRLEKLFDGTIGGVEGFNLLLGEDCSESDLEEWLQRIDLAETGLLCARTLLRIMTAGREEKQIYSEEYLNAVVRALEHVIDTILIPVVEARSSGISEDNFKAYSAQKRPLTSLLLTADKVLRLFGKLIAKVDVADSAVTKVEYISTRLIFVENAPTEKDSCLGIQRFEVLRRTAMDVLAQIFRRYPDQRTSIIDEILVSLEKLPSTRQTARQFKLPEGKPIQLVSALLMRLVQASASTVSDSKRHNSGLESGGQKPEDEDDDESGSDIPLAKKRVPSVSTDEDEEVDELEQRASKLRASVASLYDGASKNASYMIQFLVQRALKSTKSGDTPYRNLLDIFTEDFLNVLGMPEWPASEILLRALLSKMISITNDEKSPVPSKNFALDVLGLMGSGISDLQLFLHNSSRSIDASQSDVAHRLSQMLNSDDGVGDVELVGFKGPYRMVVQYLSPDAAKDPQIQSALAFFTTQWAKNLLSVIDNNPNVSILKQLPHILRKSIADHTWLQTEYDFPAVSSSQARLASALVASCSPFCKFQAQILQRLLVFMTSPAPTLMNRSLKSVNQLIDKDPSIVARSDDVLKQILFCTDAASSLVRDSALSLLGKCLIHRSSLDKQVYRRVLARVADEAVIVRKRAMRTLKDIYMRNDSGDMKSDIASMLLTRMRDPDESVSDLARQIFEELWMVPFYESSKKDSVQQQLALQKHVNLFVRTVRVGVFPQAELENFLRRILSNSAKNATANYKVCKKMVAAIMEAIVDNEERPDKPSQYHLADSLSVFAKIQPKLFTNDQVKLLATYLRNLSVENLPMFRTVVVIYTYVLPVMSSTVDHDFLGGVQADLMGSLTRLQKTELEVAAECLWIVTGILKSRERLVRLLLGVLNNIKAKNETNLADESQTKAADQIRRFIHLAGAFGSACDFDAQANDFRERFAEWKGSAVSGLIVDTVYPFTRQKQPQLVREAALECIATISQAWPQLYLRADVSKAFELVFVNDEERLEHIVLNGFQEFFAKAEARSETGADIKVGEGVVHGQERLATSYAATDQDGAAAAISQKLLPQFIRVALEKDDNLALCATLVIASVYRQGLVHPKICVPAFVALETSPNMQVAATAFEEHRKLHHAHESMIEKEYMDAVKQAYKFQKNVLEHARGFTVRKSDDKQHLEAKHAVRVPKLRSLFAVMNGGGAKVRKRFLTNLCKEMDFDLNELDTSGETPERVIFTRFTVENLALFDFERIDDVIVVVLALQKLVTEGVGVSVAQAIEEEVLNVRIDPTTSDTADSLLQLTGFDMALGPIDVSLPAESTPSAPTIDIHPARLRQLTVAATILTMIWETRTYLRQLWGLQKKMNQKANARDPKKAVTKTAGVNSDHLFDDLSGMMLTALNDGDAQRQQCQRFVEIVNIDREHRAASEEDELDAADILGTTKMDGYETPNEEGSRSSGSQPPSTSGKGRKRKSSVGPQTPAKRRKSSTPKKSKAANGRRRSRGGSRSTDDDDNDDDYDGGWG